MCGSTEIIITKRQWEIILTEVMKKLPEEACGLLAGKDNQVFEVIPIENIKHSPFRYRMNPQDQLAAFQYIEKQEWDLLAIYHSHPDGPGYPSDTDIQEAYYPEAIYIIISGDPEYPKPRGFIITEGHVQEISIRIDNQE